ncbi:unnamed protein product [Rotaria sordida]|uniref:Uncharacterized protein n=1 Tax=Rotaria sordida TaxID=392033 RepID=A0A818WXM4_9BILA|nr:unnamed protein product [Rotaria sordida]CAF3731846.1 unnamed protein product [Rotaria sordida]
MSQAHYEANRLSSERPYTMSSSRKCLLPFRMRRPQTAPDIKISHRFSHPNENIVRQITHEHVLAIGDRLLTQIQRNNENRIQQTYQQLIEAERIRMENEHRKKSDEITQKWQAKLEEEKVKLQKELDDGFINMERTRRERNQVEEQALIRRMKDECDQALARQWKHANEQLSLAVKQGEDRLRVLLELKYLEEKEQFAQELIAKKDAEYAEQELKAVEKVKVELTKEHNQDIKIIKERHSQEIAELKNKLKLTEERFRREFSLRSRLESDFRLLQTDYKRFMDNSNVFHSDYMLKLYHIGEQIGDAKFEQVLDRILAESNIQHIPSQSVKTQIHKSKHSLKLHDK